jgi:hypothetical protein
MDSISNHHLAPVIFQKFFALLLCTLPITTQAAQPESPQLDLFSVQLTHIETRQQNSYRFDTSLTSSSPNNMGLSKTSRLPTFSEYKKGTFWITSIRWHLTIDDNRASLSPQFRVESKESRLEVRPLPRSVFVTWRKYLY